MLDFLKKQEVERSPVVLALQEELSRSKAIIAELNTKLKVAAADLEKAKELAAKEKSSGDAANLALKEALQKLDALKKIEGEHKATLNLKSKELAELQANLAKAKQDTDKAAADAATLGAQLLDKTDRAKKLQAQVDKATSDLTIATNEMKATQARYDDAVKEKKSLQNQIDALSKAPTELKNTIEAQKAELAKLHAEIEKIGKQKAQDQAKQDDVMQDNELLLLQLMQAQEELVEYYEEKERFEKLYEIYKARWDRLEKRHPNYIDFGELELVAFDHASNVPSLTWRVRDYAFGGLALPEFLFQIALQNEHPGIGLVTTTNAVAEEDSTLVPKLLAQRPQQVNYFLAMSTTEQRQLSAALSILGQLEANQWRGLVVPQELDLSFWKPSITQLIAQWKALPISLRFDQVKLKRELINTDYEHLWLELHGVSYGKQSWKKFEVRLGAALIQPDGFSQFPKFEIPLIDGKHKPFESWYAESYDDSGAKFELRFSIEKGVFDTTALAKLSELDRSLVLRLVYGMPAALQKLQQQGDSIHRDWETWRRFALQATQILLGSGKVANINPEELVKSGVNELKSAPTQDLVADQKIAIGVKSDTSKVPINSVSSQAKIIRVSAEAAQKKISPAKKTLVPSSISIKDKKNDATVKEKSAVVKVPNKTKKTSTTSKSQRRAA